MISFSEREPEKGGKTSDLYNTIQILFPEPFLPVQTGEGPDGASAVHEGGLLDPADGAHAVHEGGPSDLA